MKEHAQRLGPIAPGSYRVVVIESDLRITGKDFTSLDDARAYADDAASEADSDTPPIALVFDENFDVVHAGQPYNMPPGRPSSG